MRTVWHAGTVALLALLAVFVAMGEAADLADGPTTCLSFLGIPQGINKARDATVNRNGNSPQRERKDPLKRIADPENLESNNPAIATAAKIKTQEDLAKQKIKAIKHLATVGCGCYPGVAESLLTALDDCIEEVRYEAALALCQTAGNRCDACADSCCNAETMQKLHEMAYGTDEKGCRMEASARVREAARLALQACQNRMPMAPAGAKPIERPVEVPAEISMRSASFGVETLAPASDRVSIYPREGMIHSTGSGFGLASYQPAVPPVQPVQPEPPPELPPDELSMLGAGFGSLGGRTTLELLEQELAGYIGPAEGTSGQEATSMASPDLAGVLQGSSTVQTVEVQRRSPVALDPHIRGYKAGQVYTQAGGVYWTPARRDLDTMLSKIDPGMIRDVIVIPGPYGLRYGPGFAFIDVVREPTPRYEGGFESHYDSSGNIRANGGQFYGRETAYGGGSDWGFRFSYGQRKGSDYIAGNNLHVPSSYHNRDIWGEISYDLNPHQRIDFAYQRLDQTDTEYPGQFFDVNFLGTYGFELRLTDDDPDRPWTKLTVESWHNRTGFQGDTSRKSNPNFPVIQRVNFALDDQFSQPVGTFNLSGRTNGAVTSSGVRAAMTFGEPKQRHVNIGADFRYLAQDLTENFVISPSPFPPPPVDLRWSTNMPHSWLSDPGVYAEWSSPLSECWTMSLGGRIDAIGTRARASDLRPNPSLPGGSRFLSQNDVLYAFYLTNEVNLNRQWTLTAGFGQAQRPPTLVERYADAMFLSLVQSGFSRVIGDPRLRPERDWQIDVGLNADYENFRGKASAFYAWVNDYITFRDDSVAKFADARLLRFTNTRLATLAGFELAGEFRLLPRLSAFGNVSYVEGRDQILDAPLPAISPLDSTVGLRLHDCERGRRWGIELAARMVDTQNRLGTIRLRDTASILEERTPGFAVWHLRAYRNYSENLSLVAGIDNLFDKIYQEHLDLRLLGPSGFPGSPTRVLSPGFTPYVALKWIY